MRRVLFHYQASPALTRRLRALEQNGLAVEIVAPADAAALAMALPHTEVLWHVAGAGHGGRDRGRTRAAADPEDRRRGQHDRP